MRPARESMKAGDIYYIVMFDDAGLTTPIVQTLRYEGDKRRPDGSRYLLFSELKPSGEVSDFIVEESHAPDLLLTAAALVETLQAAFSGRLPQRSRGE